MWAISDDLKTVFIVVVVGANRAPSGRILPWDTATLPAAPPWEGSGLFDVATRAIHGEKYLLGFCGAEVLVPVEVTVGQRAVAGVHHLFPPLASARAARAAK